MAERDVPLYSVMATNTSIKAGDTSYPTVEADLTQDFGLQRVIRGLESIDLEVQYKDINGNLIDPDNNAVSISLYDPNNSLFIQDTETRTATGEYIYTFTPPVTSSIGIYKAVHSTTISGSAITTENFFKIVASNPGSYYGKIVRGEDTVTATLSTEATQSIDIGGQVYVKIKSPTGVIISEGYAAGNVYTYSPGYNDSEGDYQVLFSFPIRGITQYEQQFFTVAARREENLLTAEEFMNSIDLLKYKNKFKNLTYDQIDNIIAEAQSMAAQYVGYPIGNKIISGEKGSIAIDGQGFIYLRPRAKSITKLLRVILRFHPVVSITLPVSGFLVDNDTGTFRYVFTAGMVIPGSIRGILNEYAFHNWYEGVIDYEIGFVRDEKIKIKRAVKLLALDILKQGYGLYDVKSVRSGNYNEVYFDPMRSLGRRDVDGMNPVQKEAFRILQYFQRAAIT